MKKNLHILANRKSQREIKSELLIVGRPLQNKGLGWSEAKLLVAALLENWNEKGNLGS